MLFFAHSKEWRKSGMVSKILFTIFVSRWIVLIEMLVILIPTTGVALLSPFGIMLIPAIPAFGIVVLLSVFGLIALWRLLFSLQGSNSAPIWVFFGLLAGLVAAAIAAFKMPITLLVYGPSILLAAHWFWLHKENAPGL